MVTGRPHWLWMCLSCTDFILKTSGRLLIFKIQISHFSPELELLQPWWGVEGVPHPPVAGWSPPWYLPKRKEGLFTNTFQVENHQSSYRNRFKAEPEMEVSAFGSLPFRGDTENVQPPVNPEH